MIEEFPRKDVEAKVAALETQVDMLETELSYLNQILVECGFPQGIHTLKDTVEELIMERAEGLSHEFKQTEE